MCGSRPNSSCTSCRTLRNARRAPDQDDLVDLFGLQAGVFECLLAGTDRAINDRLDHLFEDFARNLALIFLAAGKSTSSFAVGCDERAILASITALRMRATASPLRRTSIPNSSPCSPRISSSAIGDQQIVDVVTAEMGIAVGGDDLENAVVQLENRNVERAAAQIVNHDDAVLFLSRP